MPRSGPIERTARKRSQPIKAQPSPVASSPQTSDSEEASAALSRRKRTRLATRANGRPKAKAKAIVDSASSSDESFVPGAPSPAHSDSGKDSSGQSDTMEESPKHKPSEDSSPTILGTSATELAAKLTAADTAPIKAKGKKATKTAKKTKGASSAAQKAPDPSYTTPDEVLATFAELITDTVPYAALCYMFEQVEATTKRLLILDMLTQFFYRVITHAPQDLLHCVYLCINRLAPQYEGVELGVGESLLIKAVAEATGRNAAKVKSDLAKLGDIGLVAKESRSNQRTVTFAMTAKPSSSSVSRKLQVGYVFKTLKQIATTSGHASMKLKVDRIKGLLAGCQNSEAKYLMRSLEGKLRIGLAEQTVLAALAHAFVHRRPEPLPEALEDRVLVLQEAAATVKSVYNELPNYDKIVPTLLDQGLDELPQVCKLTAGIPVKPMLAHPTKAISEVLDRFEGHTFTCEYKYDGERAQIHRLATGETMIFSRNAEDMTAKYPDVVDKINRAVKSTTQSFILDCEAVAWDRVQDKILPFQVLSTRKRKDVKESEITVQVCIFAFDLLFLNGQSLLRTPLEDRQQLLGGAFQRVQGDFEFAKALRTSEVEEIQTFLDESIHDNCEGLMIKMLDGDEASYEPSKRSRNWLKVKKDYIMGLGDSLDLVVVGAYLGRGKRTGVYGGYLLACYNPDNEHYETICKIGTGFSEADLASHRDLLQENIIAQPRSYYEFSDAANKPDVWFDPKMVWEVKAADLSISPVYKAAVGRVDATKGISLRFPRFIRIRDDKSPEDATNSDQVADMYHSQKINAIKANDGSDDDY
ncbi:ATP-dependent DNA ligase Cdc17 [Dimargaris xerosporica]|nr:ATP-dependent DNA ligase Cdc17 [Dimargaris xerosporica]